MRRRTIGVLGELAVLSSLGLAATWSLPSGASSAGSHPVNGGGTSFAGVDVEASRSDVAKPPYNLTVNYASVSSTIGRFGFIDGTLDFVISDLPFQPGYEEQQVTAKRPNFTYVPIGAGGVAFMYHLADQNKNRITDLKLSSRTVCGIFTGQLTNWNDPAIVADTGHPMPDTTIYPVIRADSSAQSLVLSEYCIDEAKDLWDGFIDSLNQHGASSPVPKEPTASWPQGWGRVRAAPYAEGVADTVADQNTEGAIGYVEIGDAEQRYFPVASVRNASGAFTQPTGTNVSNALETASVRPDGTRVPNFKSPGADVYHPSTYSYLIAPTTGFDPQKGVVLGTFINYLLTKGQAKAVSQGDAPLPPSVVAAGLETVQKIPGATSSSGAAVEDDANWSEGSSSSGREVALGAGTSGGPTPAAASTGGSTVGEAAAGGLDTGAVTPAVGPLGATGGEHLLLALAGAGLALGGEKIRRSKAPPAPR